MTSSPSIIDGSLVYTDDHHLTDEFSARLAKPMLEALQPALDRARVG